MKISRRQGIAAAAAAAVLAVGGYLLHVRQQLLKDQFDAIVGHILERGENKKGTDSFVCSEGDMGIWTDRHSIQYERPYPDIRPSSQSRAVKEPNPIIGLFHPIQTFGMFNEQSAGPSTPSKVLQGLADTANEFCR